jgi:hypothetical protein
LNLFIEQKLHQSPARCRRLMLLPRVSTKGLGRTPEKAETFKHLGVDLPESLRTQYKTACSRAKQKMVAELLAFIERQTAELEQEP